MTLGVHLCLQHIYRNAANTCLEWLHQYGILNRAVFWHTLFFAFDLYKSLYCRANAMAVCRNHQCKQLSFSVIMSRGVKVYYESTDAIHRLLSAKRR